MCLCTATVDGRGYTALHAAVEAITNMEHESVVVPMLEAAGGQQLMQARTPNRCVTVIASTHVHCCSCSVINSVKPRCGNCQHVLAAQYEQRALIYSILL
jgi:hypothetical protein